MKDDKKEELRKKFEEFQHTKSYERFGDMVTMNNVFDFFYAEIEAREQEINMLRVVDEKQRKDNENLKSTMIAAAEEIMRCWPDHCDDDGYGPANLMHRLEKGIAANYPGYKFGAFTNMQAKISHLEELLKAADEVITYNYRMDRDGFKASKEALERYQTLKNKQ